MHADNSRLPWPSFGNAGHIGERVRVINGKRTDLSQLISSAVCIRILSRTIYGRMFLRTFQRMKIGVDPGATPPFFSGHIVTRPVANYLTG